MNNNLETVFLIKFFRQHILKLGVNKFAYKLNLNPATISRWENESRKPSYTNIKKICNAFNLPDNAFTLSKNTITNFINLYIDYNTDLKTPDKIDLIISISKNKFDQLTKEHILKSAYELSCKYFGKKHIKTLKIKSRITNNSQTTIQKVEELNDLLNYYKELDIKNYIAIICFNLANNYLKLRDYRQAGFFIKDTLKLCKKDTNFELWCDTQFLLATKYSRQKEYQKAEPIFKELINIYEKCFKNSLRLINLYNSLSTYYFRRCDYDKAKTYMTKGFLILNDYTETNQTLEIREHFTYLKYKITQKEYTYNKAKWLKKKLKNIKDELISLTEKTNNETLKKALLNL